TGPHERVYLSWLEPTGDTAHALRFATLTGDQWSAPRTITQGSRFFVNWADFPSIVVAPDNRLAAHWLQRSDTARYAYGVRVAQSFDGGASWSQPITPHRDGSATEHGFVSLFAVRDSLGAVWLDGRNFAGAGENSRPSMMLMTTTVASDGSTGAERVLDERVCDCCQTSIAVAASGPVVVYRDRSLNEIRDISIIRWTDSGWTRPIPVHSDQWKIDHCPVNGPAVAADGEHVAVAWFTSSGDSGRVLLAQSDDGGATFAAPVRIDDGNPVGRVDVVTHRTGLVVSWMEFTSERQAEVRVRPVSRSGQLGESTVIARSSGERASGFPHIAVSRGYLIIAWTEAGSPPRVRVARTQLDPAD
ncbi:MAG: glycoside hydrolase, partial [Gemmatimonadota bacterium]|nr:glycoside hydrolase [Gemmatimonadota bacterium]